MARLTGQALLDYVKQQEGTDRDAIIEGAGYIVRRGEKVSLQRTKFFEALSQAQGLDLGPAPVATRSTPAGFGARAQYRIKVGAKGLLPVSAAYTKQVGLTPGSYATVEIDAGAIVLYPAEAKSEAAAEAPVACPAPQPIPLQQDPMAMMLAA